MLLLVGGGGRRGAADAAHCERPVGERERFPEEPAQLQELDKAFGLAGTGNNEVAFRYQVRGAP